MAKKSRNMVASFQADGEPRQVTVEFIKGQAVVFLDGEEKGRYSTKKAANWGGIYEDFPLEVNGKEYIVSVTPKVIRIAADNVYLDTGETFYPVQPLPAWYWIFFVLFVIIPILSVGGVINILFAIMGISLCGKAVRNPRSSTATKLILCILTTVGIYIIWILFMLFVAGVRGLI